MNDLMGTQVSHLFQDYHIMAMDLLCTIGITPTTLSVWMCLLPVACLTLLRLEVSQPGLNLNEYTLWDYDPLAKQE